MRHAIPSIALIALLAGALAQAQEPEEPVWGTEGLEVP
jgi:hypothetical protein